MSATAGSRGSGELSRLVDAVLLPGFAGGTPPDWVRARVAAGLGGVVLFARNVTGAGQLADLTAALRAEREDVVVAIDEEGGDVTRLDAATGSLVPGNWALGVVDDPALTAAVAAAQARRLAAAGITLTLAPVADVNSNPENPVIGVRSFGADPDLVARHTVAFVAGTQSVGVAACAKHFPGHGDTSVDSHRGLPTVSGDLRGALRPFAAAVSAGVRAVMTAHLRLPAYDELPATVSPAVVTGLLRGELGFSGAIVSDALEMAAVAGTVGLAEGAVLALLAGVDALCLGAHNGAQVTAEVHAAVLASVRDGRLPEQRLVDAAARTATLGGPVDAAARATTATATGPALPPEAGESVVSRAAAEALGLAAARLALRPRGLLPLPPGAAPVLVEFDPEPGIAVGPTAWGLAATLTSRRPGTLVLRLGPDDPVPVPPAGRPLVVVVRDAARHGWQRDAVAALLAAHPEARLVEMGLPGPDPAAGGYLSTGGASLASAVAAAELLAGEPW